MRFHELWSSRWTPLIAMGVLIAAIAVPWVDVGSAADTSIVLGYEIPVLGIATLVVCLVGASLALLGALHGSCWWWVSVAGVAGLIATVTSLWLVTLDVIDSALVRAIRRSLPETVRDASPTIRMDVGLWLYLGVGAIACVLAARLAVQSANRRWEVVDDPLAAPDGDVWSHDPRTSGFTPANEVYWDD